LHVHGNHSSAQFISSVTCPVKRVNFVKVPAPLIYSFVEKLGPEITELAINMDKQPLDLPKVLAACPKIEILEVFTKGSLEKSAILLTPQHFASYKE